MLGKLSLVLTCGVLASSFSMSAQTSPLSSVRPQQTAAVITLVRDGCGLGFHMAVCGCIRNYTACPVIVAPVSAGSRCATVRATRRCYAGRLSVWLLPRSVRSMPAVLNQPKGGVGFGAPFLFCCCCAGFRSTPRVKFCIRKVVVA